MSAGAPQTAGGLGWIGPVAPPTVTPAVVSAAFAIAAVLLAVAALLLAVASLQRRAAAAPSLRVHRIHTLGSWCCYAAGAFVAYGGIAIGLARVSLGRWWWDYVPQWCPPAATSLAVVVAGGGLWVLLGYPRLPAAADPVSDERTASDSQRPRQ